MGLFDILMNAINGAANVANREGYDPNSTVFYPGARARQAGLTQESADQMSGEGGSQALFNERLMQAREASQQPQPQQQEEPQYVFGPANETKLPFETDQKDESIFKTGSGSSTKKESNKKPEEQIWDPQLLYQGAPVGATPAGVEFGDSVFYMNPDFEPNLSLEEASQPDAAEKTSNPDRQRNAIKAMNERRHVNQDYWNEDGSFNEDLALRDMATDEGFAPALLALSGIKQDSFEDPLQYYDLLNQLNEYRPQSVTVNPNTGAPINRDIYVQNEGEEVGGKKYEEDVNAARKSQAEKVLSAILGSNVIQEGLGDKYQMGRKSEYSEEDEKKKQELLYRIYELNDTKNLLKDQSGNYMSYDARMAEKADLEKQLEDLEQNAVKIGSSDERKKLRDQELYDIIFGKKGTPATDETPEEKGRVGIKEALENIYGVSLSDIAADMLGLAAGDKALITGEATGSTAEGAPRKEQIEEFNDWIAKGGDDVDLFFELHPQLAGWRGDKDLYSYIRMLGDEDIMRDLYGYGNIVGIAPWRERIRNEGIDADAEDAWEKVWDLIYNQRGIRRSDLWNGTNRNRLGSALSAGALAYYLASERGRKEWGDLLNWEQILKSADGLYTFDEGDAANLMIMTMLNNPELRASMNADDLLKAANAGLSYAGDEMELGWIDDSGLYEDQSWRNHPRSGGYDFYQVNDYIPYGSGIMDQDMLDTYMSYILNELEGSGSENKLGLAKRGQK